MLLMCVSTTNHKSLQVQLVLFNDSEAAEESVMSNSSALLIITGSIPV